MLICLKWLIINLGTLENFDMTVVVVVKEDLRRFGGRIEARLVISKKAPVNGKEWVVAYQHLRQQ